MAYVVLALLFWLIAILTSMEMATFSARKERMVQAARAGDRRGTLVNVYQRSPADYLSAIQLVATAANFIVGAMIGANVETPMRVQIEAWAPGFLYNPQISWFLSVGIVTVVALALTNVLPKHIGFVRANEIALKTAFPMRLWIRLTWPITSAVRLAAKGLARALHVSPDEKFRVTESDIEALLAEGLQAGSLDPTEQNVMRRAMRLSETRVCDVMARAAQIVWIDAAWPLKKVKAYMREHGRTTYLVAEKRLDKLIGVVRALDVFSNDDLESAITPFVSIQASASLLQALEKLRPRETRLLVAMDHGEIVGVITLNDVLSHVVGPIRQT